MKNSRAFEKHTLGFWWCVYRISLYSTGAYANHLGIEDAALVKLVLGYGMSDGDHHWHRLERGEITMNEAAKEAIAAVEASGVKGFDIRDFFKSMGGENESTKAMFEAVFPVQGNGINPIYSFQ